MEVTPKNQVAYGEDIQDKVDQNINVMEQGNEDEVFESSSSATAPFIINNASSLSLDRTVDNEIQTTPWIVGNIDIIDLFQQYRRHVTTIDLPFPLETSLKELLAVANILFLAPMDHSSDMRFIKVTDTINAVDSKSISVREGKRDLLNLAATMNNTTGNVIEGLANLLTKLPRLPILDMPKIGKVELQSTYFDVFLSEIIADQDKQVALRWANKSVHQGLTDMRPDAIISTLVQHEFGCPLGFGETKAEDGQGNLYEDSGSEAMSVDESLSFRLSKLKALQKFIKHMLADMSRLLQDSADVVMKDAANVKNDTAAKLANVDTHTAPGRQQTSQLNDQHKKQLVDFYDEKPTATIENGVEELIKIFEGLAEFMKDECNLSIKSVTRHSAERNSPKTIKARAVWVAEWSAKEIDYHNNWKVWSRRDEPTIVATSSTRAISKTALGAVSSSSIINVRVLENLAI
ncbi:hypothetical protein BDF21DRAFT_466013 [Thamnidium elegans]|nr:hypothetical protein BDF21DRAFT_466013 [Thamnidium elegans]